MILTLVALVLVPAAAFGLGSLVRRVKREALISKHTRCLLCNGSGRYSEAGAERVREVSAGSGL